MLIVQNVLLRRWARGASACIEGAMAHIDKLESALRAITKSDSSSECHRLAREALKKPKKAAPRNSRN